VTVNLAVNYLAVVVAAVAAVVVGIVYYGLAGLGDRLARLMGSTPLGRPGPAQLVIGVVVSLVNAWVLALLSLNLGAASITDAIMLGVLAWLGFMATLSGAQVAFQGRPWNAWLITNVHDVAIQVVMAAIVTLWR
jgi:ABC-type multidrug transport system permease subunit